jgi:hypothetical protein
LVPELDQQALQRAVTESLSKMQKFVETESRDLPWKA